jgi:hypothetical protein
MRLADPMAPVGEYQAAGGGEALAGALAGALTAPPGEVIAEVIRSGWRRRP